MNSTNPINPNPEYIEKKFILSFKLSTIQSFILTFLAELGDKTFIMLIILQLKANIFFNVCRINNEYNSNNYRNDNRLYVI